MSLPMVTEITTAREKISCATFQENPTNGLVEGCLNYGMRAHNGAPKKFPWHAAFTAVPHFQISFARPPSPYCAQYVYIYRYLTPYRLYINCRCYTNLNGANCSLDIYCCGAGLAVTGPIRDIGQNVLLSAFGQEAAAAAARLLPLGLAYRISGGDRYWKYNVTVC